MRPRTLDEMVGQAHLLGPGAPLRALIETDRLSSVILWGPPGTGKTTLASIVASRTNREFVAMSAVSAGVKDVREVIGRARQRLADEERGTIFFLDEVHRFNKSQQDALLPAVDLIDMAGGDARAVLNTLEVALALAASDDRAELTIDDAEQACQTRVLRYGEDEHYDIISAFIKSIRGSDPDAGLYWLARMIQAGEDARYIARRLVILASEDVGMADSNGLVVADAAARAVEFVGLPEATLNLAHAVVYLATAPKSNTTMAALSRAFNDVAKRQAGAVPGYLRSIHPYQRNKLKEGGGYRYPHNDPSGFIRQEYRPPEIAGEIGSPERRLYYRPSPHGDERVVADRLREWWGDAAYDTEEWWEFEKFRDPDR